VSTERYQLTDLLQLMARLRDPQSGCPWDLRQDFSSIVPHTIEEAYEVADAIEQADFDHLPDELGDLLFQVVFYARLGEEGDLFDFTDVVDGVVRKLLRRHPHVFPDGTLESRRDGHSPVATEAVAGQWEQIKSLERADKSADNSAMAGVSRGLPAFIRAEKLQKRASRQGFDWPETEAVFAKLHEEIDELREACQARAAGHGSQEDIEDELGDLLFVCVNLSRFLGVDAEQSLRRSNRKFERRFRMMETILAENDGSFSGRDMAALDALWQSAKKRDRETGLESR